MSSYNKQQFRRDLARLKGLQHKYRQQVQRGGGQKHRTFSLYKVNGVVLKNKVGCYKIKKKSSSGPADAALKAAKKYIEKNKKNMNKKTTIHIIENTKETQSKNKVYGPYTIIVKRLSGDELKKKQEKLNKISKIFGSKLTAKNYNVSVEI